MSVIVKRFNAIDPRLSRHVRHDSRSWNYQFVAKDAQPEHKNTFWKGNAKALNQLKLGSCTGNASAQWFNTDFAKACRKIVHNNRLMTENDAKQIYHIGTTLDDAQGTWPPTDTGCDGLSVAKACSQLGYLRSYGHVFSLDAFKATCELTPCIVGTVWTKAMFNCHDGIVGVGSLSDSNIAGGHEYLSCGINWDVGVFIFRQSWGKWLGAKPGGYFAIGFDDFGRLLDMQGDVTVFYGKGLN